MNALDELALVVGDDDPLAGLPREGVQRILAVPFNAEERGRLAMARAAPPQICRFILADILARRRVQFSAYQTFQAMEISNMTEPTDKPKGTIRAFLNPDKLPGDDKPAFTGTLTFPGDEKERAFALWSRKDKNGGVILSGRIHVVSGSALDQITGLTTEEETKAEKLTVGKGAKPLSLKPREVVLFENKNKGDKRPDFYGWHHTGQAGREPLQVAVWAKIDTNGRAYITGNLQEPTPQQEQEQVQEQDTEPEMAS